MATFDSNDRNSNNPVIPDFAVLDASTAELELIENPHQDANVRGGDPWVPPAHFGQSGIITQSRIPDWPPQKNTPLIFGEKYKQISSTPAQVDEAKHFFAEWTSTETEANKQHGKQRSTVFSVMQYREHPESGQTLWTQEQWDSLIAGLDSDGVLMRHASIWHDQDLNDSGQIKPLHFHGVIQLTAGSEKQISYLARRAFLPASRIQTAKTTFVRGGVTSGPNVANIAFFDFCEYLVHENSSSRKVGKNLYSRDEVLANFDFAGFLDAGRPLAGGKQAAKKMSDVDELAMRVQEDGLSVADAQKEDPLAFNRGETRIRRARAAYLSSQPLPPLRINIYIYGKGGVGKDALARALARQLVPGDWEPGVKEPFFVLGGENVAWEGYDGEPVVIIEEARAGSLIKSFGRKELFTFLNPFPAKQKLNVKNSSVLPINTITIMTGQEDYLSFLNGLAGEYKDRDGLQHQAEDKGQAYRRVPLVIPMDIDSFTLLCNSGFMDGQASFLEYQTVGVFKQSMRELLTRTKGLPEAQLQIEAAQVQPIVEQYDRVVAATSIDSEDPDALVAEFLASGIGSRDWSNEVSRLSELEAEIATLQAKTQPDPVSGFDVNGTWPVPADFDFEQEALAQLEQFHINKHFELERLHSEREALLVEFLSHGVKPFDISETVH